MSTSSATQTRMGSYSPRRKLSQLWQAPTFLVGVLALVLVSTGAAVRHHKQTNQLEQQLSQLHERLQEAEEVGNLLPVARELVDSADGLGSTQEGEAQLVLGMVLLRLADDSAADRARTLRSQAKEHLEKAQSLGVESKDIARLWYHLGKAHFLTGGDVQLVVDYLSRSLPQGADNPAEGYGLLVQAYLNLPTPDLDAALQTNLKQLKSTNEESILTPARLLRGKLLVEKDQHFEALKVLDRIDSSASQPLHQKALYLRAVACEAEGLWNKAVPLWEGLRENPKEVPGGKLRVLYTLGRCYQNSTPPQEEKAVETWKALRDEEGEEGQAAALRLAEAYLFEPRRNFEKALQEFQRAFRNVKSERDYTNNLISLEDARKLVDLAAQIAQENADFFQAQAFCQLYEKISLTGIADKKFAEISEAWADALETEAKNTAGPEKIDLREQARKKCDQAARAYQQTANTLPVDKRGPFLWKSAQCYRRADKPLQAVQVLEEYVKLSQAPDLQGKGLYFLAETRLELGHKEEAEKAFFECMNNWSSVYASQARFQVAQLRIEQQRITEAIDILEQTIKLGDPTRDAEAIEKSLYKLASLLYQEENYLKAYLRFKEAVKLYPDNPQVMLAREQLGDTYRKLAQTPKTKPTENLPVHKEDHLRHSRGQWLELAQEVYEKLEQELEKKRGRQPLSELENKIYRKASIVSADIQFDMSNYQEALRRYKGLRKKFQGQMEELIACQRILLCFQNMTDAQQKQQALEALKVSVKSVKKTLKNIPEEQFKGVSSPQEWENWLNAIETRLFPASISLPQAPTKGAKTEG